MNFTYTPSDQSVLLQHLNNPVQTLLSGQVGGHLLHGSIPPMPALIRYPIALRIVPAGFMLDEVLLAEVLRAREMLDITNEAATALARVLLATLYNTNLVAVNTLLTTFLQDFRPSVPQVCAIIRRPHHIAQLLARCVLYFVENEILRRIEVYENGSGRHYTFFFRDGGSLNWTNLLKDKAALETVFLALGIPLSYNNNRSTRVAALKAYLDPQPLGAFPMSRAGFARLFAATPPAVLVPPVQHRQPHAPSIPATLNTRLRKDQLMALAAQRGVQVGQNWTNAALYAALLQRQQNANQLQIVAPTPNDMQHALFADCGVNGSVEFRLEVPGGHHTLSVDSSCTEPQLQTVLRILQVSLSREFMPIVTCADHAAGPLQ